MKPDNYDIPGYQFFLVKPGHNYMKGEDTAKRISNICEEIFLACYINIPSLHEFRYHSKIFYYLLPDNSLTKKRYEDMAIDEFVTERMKEKYNNNSLSKNSLSKAERRVYNCFLTRYGSEEFVKQKH